MSPIIEDGGTICPGGVDADVGGTPSGLMETVLADPGDSGEIGDSSGAWTAARIGACGSPAGGRTCGALLRSS